MVLRLAERLDVPLRERNALLARRRLCADVPRTAARRPGARRGARRRRPLLTGHEPSPPSRSTGTGSWSPPTASCAPLLEGVAPELLDAAGQRDAADAASRTASRRASSTWRNGARTCSPGCASRSRRARTRRLQELLRELRDYPAPAAAAHARRPRRAGAIVVPLQLATRGRRARLLRHDHDLRHAGRRDAVRTRDREPSSRPTRRPRRRCGGSRKAWEAREFLSSSAPLRRHVGAGAVRDLGRHADALAQRRVRMDRLADVDRVGAHLDRQRDLADQVAGMRADDAAADDAVASAASNSSLVKPSSRPLAMARPEARPREHGPS